MYCVTRVYRARRAPVIYIEYETLSFLYLDEEAIQRNFEDFSFLRAPFNRELAGDRNYYVPESIRMTTDE